MGPDSCHITSRLRRLSSRWCTCMCHSACELTQYAAVRVVINLPMSPHTALATGGSSNPIQLVLRSSAANGSGSNMEDMVRLYTPSRLLRSMTAKRLAASAPSLWGPPAGAQLNPDCSLSWPHNGRTSSTLTSGQLNPFTSSATARKLIC